MNTLLSLSSYCCQFRWTYQRATYGEYSASQLAGETTRRTLQCGKVSLLVQQLSSTYACLSVLWKYQIKSKSICHEADQLSNCDFVQINAGGDMTVLSNFDQNAIRCGFLMEQASSMVLMCHVYGSCCVQ